MQGLRVHPDREEFKALTREWSLVPVWTELSSDVSTPVGVFPSLAGGGPGVLLESVERSERWGRYSFVAGDPAAIVIADRDGVRLERVSRELPVEGPSAEDGDVLGALKRVAASLRAPRLPELPPLTGGLVGSLAYEAAELLDGHPFPGDPPGPPIGLQIVDRA